MLGHSRAHRLFGRADQRVAMRSQKAFATRPKCDVESFWPRRRRLRHRREADDGAGGKRARPAEPSALHRLTVAYVSNTTTSGDDHDAIRRRRSAQGASHGLNRMCSHRGERGKETPRERVVSEAELKTFLGALGPTRIGDHNGCWYLGQRREESWSIPGGLTGRTKHKLCPWRRRQAG